MKTYTPRCYFPVWLFVLLFSSLSFAKSTVVCEELDDQLESHGETRVIVTLNEQAPGAMEIAFSLIGRVPVPAEEGVDADEHEELVEVELHYELVDLVAAEGIEVTTTPDSGGTLRIIDFAMNDPEASVEVVEAGLDGGAIRKLSGLRGSVAFHDEPLNSETYATLYYRATGNVLSLRLLNCRSF